MGKIIQATFDQILPGEYGVNLEKLAGVIRFVEQGGEILPVPVRRFRGKFIHLDGRNRLIYQYLMKMKEVPLYLALDSNDLMRPKVFPKVPGEVLYSNNLHIIERWVDVVDFHRNEGVKNYHEHFRELKRDDNFLEDFETCREYLSRIGSLPPREKTLVAA